MSTTIATKICLVVFDPDCDPDGENSVRILVPEAFARAIATQPGVTVTQDDDECLVVLAGVTANVQVDLHL